MRRPTLGITPQTFLSCWSQHLFLFPASCLIEPSPLLGIRLSPFLIRRRKWFLIALECSPHLVSPSFSRHGRAVFLNPFGGYLSLLFFRHLFCYLSLSLEGILLLPSRLTASALYLELLRPTALVVVPMDFISDFGSSPRPFFYIIKPFLASFSVF